MKSLQQQLREGMKNILALQPKDKPMCEPIKTEPGTGGQNPQWPGDGHAPESGTESTEKDGTRKPEKIIIPIVQ